MDELPLGQLSNRTLGFTYATSRRQRQASCCAPEARGIAPAGELSLPLCATPRLQHAESIIDYA